MANSPSFEVSIARLLENATDRKGNPYIIDGKLQFEDGVIVSLPVTKEPLNHESVAPEDNPISKFTPNELSKQIFEVFPNAQNVESDGESVTFALPNGYKMRVNFTDEKIAIDKQ